MGEARLLITVRLLLARDTENCPRHRLQTLVSDLSFALETPTVGTVGDPIQSGANVAQDVRPTLETPGSQVAVRGAEYFIHRIGCRTIAIPSRLPSSRASSPVFKFKIVRNLSSSLRVIASPSSLPEYAPIPEWKHREIEGFLINPLTDERHPTFVVSADSFLAQTDRSGAGATGLDD